MRLKIRKFLQRLVISIFKIFGFRIVHFIHIGKTAGTALKTAASSKTFIWKNFRVTNGNLFIFQKHKFDLDEVRDNEFIFFVIRDPLKRFVSGFNSRLRMGRPRNYHPWLNGEEEAFRIFKTPNQLAESLSSTDEEIKESAKNAMYSILHVKHSYWFWFKDEQYLEARKKNILAILRQDHFTKDFERFCKEQNVNLGKLPQDDVHAHRSPEGLDSSLSETATENLMKWYERDYQFLQVLHTNNFPLYRDRFLQD